MARYPAKPPPEPVAAPPGLATRRAVLRLLDAVLRRGDPLELALHGAAQGLPPADRALAHAIAADVLRHMADLDALIDGTTQQILPEDAKARMVLRIALVQLLLLATPPHAAIATALPLLDGGPRRLVHGVLGALIRSGATLPEVPALPAPVVARWTAQWGEGVVANAALSSATRAPIDINIADADATARWTEALQGVSLAPGHVRISHDSTIATLPGYAEGAWWVQDIAASIPARLAGDGAGRSAIDLCAAPGGKTMQLAAHGWSVKALDKSAKRLERLAENMARARLAAQVVQADILDWTPDEPADLVLLDAPCTATGIFRRHPDVLHRVGDRQIAEMAEVQARLLPHAAAMVAPGGTLIYATCSLERAEGEDQVVRFLSMHDDFALVPPAAGELPEGIFAQEQGWLRILPGVLAEAGGADGFFIARMVRTG